MRGALLCLMLMLTFPAWAQPRPNAGRFDTALAASVFTAALAFTAPRTIEAVTIPQLTLWGLRGVTAFDTGLTVQLRDGAIVLDVGGKAQFQRGAPALPTAEAWSAAAADVFAAAWDASPALQEAGTQGLIGGFFDEMFNHLDPYSRYVAPEAADVDRARRSGETGIGIQVARRGGIVVTDVNADGPAAEAGVTVGDKLVAIDGQPVRADAPAAVMARLSGTEGSAVVLTLRGRDGRVRQAEVERAVIPPETVSAQRAGNALVLRISSFRDYTAQQLAREIDTAFNGTVPAGRRPRGLVLDLRGNRGGVLRQAVTAADMLLDAGIIAVTEGRNPDAFHRWAATSGDLTSGVPIIVLVDGRTASSAEILTAALADNGRAVVVGSSTLGKGLVQTIGRLPDGGELFVTWSRVLAPRGWPIQGLGVLPQVCTSLGQDSLAQQLASLDRGTPRMQAALERHRSARVPVAAAAILDQRNACPAGEARDGDMLAARYLLEHPAAYAAARLVPASAQAAQ